MCKWLFSKFIKNKTKLRIKELHVLKDRIKKSNNKISELLSYMESQQMLINSIFEAIPDWVWHKDINGVYLRANKRIREELFCGLPESTVVGKDDIELASLLRDKYGEDNHTFGELCLNSDGLVTCKQGYMRFNEHGKVKGEELRIIVRKDVLRDCTGKVVGTVGVGYNITKDYDTISAIANTMVDGDVKDRLIEYNNRYLLERV